MTILLQWLWSLLPANPVLVRIVQGGSRRRRHLWVRMGYLGALVAMVSIGLLVGGGMGSEISLTDLAKAGTLIFTIISYGQVIMICLLAPLFTAGAISQERIGRTYEILLTTPLSNLQIVLGSLFGRLFFVWALLLSGLPLFAVSLIFGGVPIDAVFTSFAVAAMTALFMGSVAVTLSVCRAGGRKAVYVFVIIVVGCLVAGYALDALVLRRVATVPGSGADGTTWLTPLHPLLVLEASLNQAGYRPPSAEVISGHPAWVRVYLSRPLAAFALITTALSGLLILFCTVTLRWMTNDRGAVGWWRRLRRWLRLDRRGDGGELKRSPRKVWANPIAWRESQARGNRAAWVIGRLGFVVVGLSAIATVLVMYHRGTLPGIPDPVHGTILKPHQSFRLTLQMLLQIEVAVAVFVAVYLSAVCVSREREDGTLDLLLTTPLTARQYIWGKLRGLVSFLTILLVVPVLTLAVASLYTLAGPRMGWQPATVPQMVISNNGPPINMQVGLVLPESPLLLLFVLVPFVALCVMVGMSWSLKASGVLGAVTPAIGVIGCLTMVTGFCGYNAVGSVPFVGPVLNAFSPVTNLWMLTDPWTRVVAFGDDPMFGRMSLAVGALTAGGCYSLVVYLMLLTMVKDFDHTVRRLSGTG